MRSIYVATLLGIAFDRCAHLEVEGALW